MTPMSDLNSLIDNQSASAQAATSTSEAESSPATVSEPKKKISKSERIRQYMRQYPEARNKDISAALAQHGVTAADVGNVKTQLKQKAAKERQAASTTATRETSTAAIGTGPQTGSDATIGMDVLEAGVEFIRKAGGINEAQYTLTLIRRIRSL